ncbi:MAG: hypothetical protein H6R41_699, partial [Deltaproteobacteria bacterium]|nr:hypothetical protein [Deltaproteobacteria bacterium]
RTRNRSHGSPPYPSVRNTIAIPGPEPRPESGAVRSIIGRTGSAGHTSSVTQKKTTPTAIRADRAVPTIDARKFFRSTLPMGIG